MTQYIIPLVNSIPHSVYAAPFAGGEAVLFAKPRHYGRSHDYREFINDIDGELINFYRIAITMPDELNRLVQATLYSQLDCKRANWILRTPHLHSELERAWAYFVATQQGFNRKKNSGWGVGVKGENSARTWASKQQELRAQLERLKGVHIACEDALVCIKRLDSLSTLFVADPPYPDTDQGKYGGKYTKADWQALCGLLDTIQGSYILSGDGQHSGPTSAQQRIEVEASCSASKEKGHSRTEVLWVCNRARQAQSFDQLPLLQPDLVL